MIQNSFRLLTDAKVVFCVLLFICQATPAAAVEYLSPTALAATPDGHTLFVACATANRVEVLDTANRRLRAAITMPQSPLGLALSRDSKQLFVTCAGPESHVCLVNVANLKITGRIPVGHTAQAPVVSPDGKTLYVCNQFNSDVSVIDLAAKKELCRIPVQREPVAADITLDGRFLLVANELPTGRADVETMAAVVSVIDLSTHKVVKELPLPNGSGELKNIRVSPDGRYAAVTHVVSSFSRATTKVQFGWMNANALSVIDLGRMEVGFSLLLDEPQRGAANPWGVAWSADGKTLAVAHAGTHEVSLIDFPALLAGLPAFFANPQAAKKSTAVLKYISHYEGLDEGLPFIVGARKRIQLPAGDLGPRAMISSGRKFYIGNYFSDTVSVIGADAATLAAESIPLGAPQPMDVVRQGEFYFHNATFCREGWQSCSSCHPGGARVDGFNWDLLNDGIGNPKSTRSLLLAHQTPPAMFLGVRTNAEVAVRAGIKFILFTNLPESVPTAIDEYLKSLQPVPSPHLVRGKLSPAAKRGEKLFLNAGCVDCHVPGLYTDLRPHDVGTRAPYDGSADKYYTPTLIEVWRTAPYLHDGSAATIREVLTTRNPEDDHGATSKLSAAEVDDLCEYVLSL